MLIAALFIIAKTRKQVKCVSADEWIKMIHICGVYTHLNTIKP